jgi:hypothetical protein
MAHGAYILRFELTREVIAAEASKVASTGTRRTNGAQNPPLPACGSKSATFGNRFGGKLIG